MQIYSTNAPIYNAISPIYNANAPIYNANAPILPVGSRKSGRSGVRCIMLGSGLGAERWTGGGGAHVARLGWWAAEGGGRHRPGLGLDRTVGLDLPLLSESEVVGLGNKNIIKFCQKVARSRINEIGSLSLNFKFANQKYYKDRRDWPTTIFTKCCK